MSVAVSGVFCFASLCFAVLPGLWIGDRTSWAREWASVRMAVPNSNPWSPVSRVIQREVAGRRATAGQRERQRDRETRGHTTNTILSYKHHIKLHTACTQSKANNARLNGAGKLISMVETWHYGKTALWYNGQAVAAACERISRSLNPPAGYSTVPCYVVPTLKSIYQTNWYTYT